MPQFSTGWLLRLIWAHTWIAIFFAEAFLRFLKAFGSKFGMKTAHGCTRFYAVLRMRLRIANARRRKRRPSTASFAQYETTVTWLAIACMPVWRPRVCSNCFTLAHVGLRTLLCALTRTIVFASVPFVGGKLKERLVQRNKHSSRSFLFRITVVSGYKPWARSAWQRGYTGSRIKSGAFASEVYLA